MGSESRRGLRCLLSAVLALLLCGCSVRKQGEQVFRIGFIAPLTGTMSSLGTSCLEGAELAVQVVNRGGGLEVAGRRVRVELVLKDCQDRPELAVGATQELINRGLVTAIVGPPMSGLAIPAARLAGRAGVPMIVQIATHPEVTRGTIGVYRTCFTDDVQAAVLARFARDDLGLETAGVLFDVTGDYNRGIAATFRRRFEELGGRVVAYESYTSDRKEFTEPLLRIARSDPDLLLLPNYIEDLLLQMDAIRRLGLRAQVLGSDTMYYRNPQDIARMEGAYCSTHYFPEDPGQPAGGFREDYQAVFDRPPTPGGALTFDALGLLFRAAVESGGVRSEDLLRGLAGVVRYDGVTGSMTYDGGPDPAKSVVIVQVEGGRYRFSARVHP